LLGFTRIRARPRYDQSKELIADEGNAIASVDLRGEILPEPFRGKILGVARVLERSRRFCEEDNAQQQAAPQEGL
jgi:hypothetical protein